MSTSYSVKSGAGRANTRRAIHNRQPFKTAGALKGQAWTTGNTGALSGADLDRYCADVNTIDYVVYSYSTPIAWHSATGWHQPDTRYSVTTTSHQSAARMGVLGIW